MTEHEKTLAAVDEIMSSPNTTNSLNRAPYIALDLAEIVRTQDAKIAELEAALDRIKEDSDATGKEERWQ